MKKILILFLVISVMAFPIKITKEKGVNISKIEMESRKNEVINLVNQVIDMDYKNKFELNYGDDQGVISTNEVINKKIKEKDYGKNNFYDIFVFTNRCIYFEHCRFH